MKVGSIKVLIVEDIQSDIDALHTFLKRVRDAGENIDIVHQTNLEEALKYLSSQTVDIILCDLFLPDSQGLDTLHQLQKIDRHSPILVLTNPENEHLGLQAIRAGAQDYLITGEIDENVFVRSFRYSLERKRTERELVQAQERFQAIFDKSPEAIVIADAQGIILSWNAMTETMLKVSSKDLYGGKIQKFITTEEWNRVVRELHHGGRRVYTFESFIETLSGNVYADVSVSLIEEYGVSGHILFFFKDISERKKIDQLKDEFLSTVSHELRTPLTIIKGAVCNLDDGIVGPLTDPQIKIVRIARGNVDRLARLINDLLDLSRLESGKTKVRRKEILIRPILQDLLDGFQIQKHEKNIQVSYHLQDEDMVAIIDPDLINQLLSNLIANALRYATSKIEMNVETCLYDDLHARSTEELRGSMGLHFSISDDGIGISDTDKPNLFSKFVQINRPIGGAGYKGTGLGLAISNEIVRRHGGEIWVEGKEGEGAQFHFFIPQYNIGEEIIDKIRLILESARQNHEVVSLISIQMMDIAKHCQSLGIDEFRLWFNELATQMSNHLYRKEDILFADEDKGEILIVAETDRRGALVIHSRFHQVVDRLKLKYENAQFKSGIKVFPIDGVDAVDLVESVRNGDAALTGKEKRVLVIDDEGDLVQMMVYALENAGFIVDVALNGKKGLERVYAFHPDLILLDVMLPELNGWEVAERLKNDPTTKEIPIFMVSASKDEDSAAKRKKFGLNHFFQKPINLTKVIGAMRKEMNR